MFFKEIKLKVFETYSKTITNKDTLPLFNFCEVHFKISQNRITHYHKVVLLKGKTDFSIKVKKVKQ